MHKQILINALFQDALMSEYWKWHTLHTNTQLKAGLLPPQVLCTFKAAEWAAIFLLNWKVTSQRGDKKKRMAGAMRIKRTSSNREKVSTSGQGIVRCRPTHNPSPPPFSHLPLSPTHPLMLASYLSSETFHLFYLCIVFLTHTVMNIHTFPRFLSPSFRSIPTLPGQLSWLPLYRAHSFITSHHLRRGHLKRTVCTAWKGIHSH